MDPRWVHPFTCVIAGPTGCGKTHFVTRFLKNLPHLVSPSAPERIVWAYGEWQTTYDQLRASLPVDFVEGIPDLTRFDSTKPSLLVLDDLMAEADERVTQLFTKGSHHRSVSVMYLVQNLFDKNKEHRTISLNAQYLVIFKNPRDKQQINHLAKQMYPGHIHFVQEAFEDATQDPHGYLLVDLKQDTPESMRLRTYIIPDTTDHLQTVYLPHHKA